MRELLAEIAKLIEQYEKDNGIILGCEVVNGEDGTAHWWEGKSFTNQERLAA